LDKKLSKMITQMGGNTFVILEADPKQGDENDPYWTGSEKII
jgi:hypothetical protein